MVSASLNRPPPEFTEHIVDRDSQLLSNRESRVVAAEHSVLCKPLARKRIGEDKIPLSRSRMRQEEQHLFSACKRGVRRWQASQDTGSRMGFSQVEILNADQN